MNQTTDQSIITQLATIEVATTQIILDGVIRETIAPVRLLNWPRMITHSMVELSRQHYNPTAFLLDLSAQLTHAATNLPKHGG
jgi:hypothetical protein